MSKAILTAKARKQTLAREAALKFLYKCEVDKVYYFSPRAFDAYALYFQVTGPVFTKSQAYCQGVLDHLSEIDHCIQAVSQRWSISRLSFTDRAVLRLAVFELICGKAPKKVILNEAIELAKRFGTHQSGGFVNGILDKIARNGLIPPSSLRARPMAEAHTS